MKLVSLPVEGNAILVNADFVVSIITHLHDPNQCIVNIFDGQDYMLPVDLSAHATAERIEQAMASGNEGLNSLIRYAFTGPLKNIAIGLYWIVGLLIAILIILLFHL